MSDLPDIENLKVEVDPGLPVDLPTEPWSEYDAANGVMNHFFPLGDGRLLKKTEFLMTQELIDQNHAEAMASQNTRWRDGYTKIASVPMNLLFNEDGLSKALKAGDDAYLNRWLNDADNRAWRTRGGVL
ncbi:MAG: hypothetical protein LCH88_09145 [Proteobacteria bacterium]|nr:hypothetical protein [Pseudomonadota bacterium]